MTKEVHRRHVERTQSSPRDEYVSEEYRQHQYRGPSGGRSHGSQSISLKSLKHTGLSCAKSLTSKIISMSNSGIQAASSAITAYKETAAANARKAALADPNSFLRISERIATTNDPITSHRELVGVIEHLLTWTGQPVQLTLEKDRFGRPTSQSMYNIRLINDFVVEKVLIYIRGRRDCCVFIYKFTNWRMRTTYQPEEIILCLELLQYCMESFGGYFLGLMTSSCMRRFKKLLKMTKISTSLAGGVKKQLTKFLVGSSNVHPGVPTDVRIHVIKAKVLYMIQLWHDVFLLDQGMYFTFFEGYRNMRESGIKFPPIDPNEKQKINLSPVVSVNRYSIAPGVALPLSPEEFDIILSTLQTLSTEMPGPQQDAALARLAESKKKLVSSINILTENRPEMADDASYEAIMRKLLLLNDCIGAHLTTGSNLEEARMKLQTIIERDNRHRIGCFCHEHDDHGDDEDKMVSVNSSSDSENEDFGNFFSSDKSGTHKKSDEDYDKFFADFGLFGNNVKSVEKMDSVHSEGGNYVNDLECLSFDNPVTTSSQDINVASAALSADKYNIRTSLSSATSSNESVEEKPKWDEYSIGGAELADSDHDVGASSSSAYTRSLNATQATTASVNSLDMMDQLDSLIGTKQEEGGPGHDDNNDTGRLLFTDSLRRRQQEDTH
eukprot:XP_001612263.1 hypothetical protein [Babesia bovis T2Bo]